MTKVLRFSHSISGIWKRPFKTHLTRRKAWIQCSPHPLTPPHNHRTSGDVYKSPSHDMLELKQHNEGLMPDSTAGGTGWPTWHYSHFGLLSPPLLTCSSSWVSCVPHAATLYYNSLKMIEHPEIFVRKLDVLLLNFYETISLNDIVLAALLIQYV